MYCKNCGIELSDKANFCDNCGEKIERRKVKNDNSKNSVPKLSDSETIVSDKNSKDEEKELPTDTMIEYLDKVKKVEIKKYSLENALNSLRETIQENKIESVSNKLYGYKFSNVFKTPFNFAKYTTITVVLVAFIYQILFINQTSLWLKIVLGVTALCIFTEGFWQAVLFGLKWGLIAGVGAFAIVFTICLIVFIISKIKTKKAQSKQDNLILEENITKGEIVKKLEKQEKEIIKELKETEKVLEKIYSINAVYKKYRNLVAITTIQEYIESGRCSSLYGYAGAYNIYENEIRQNTIISKLDDILVSLDQIKQGQYAIFLAVQEGNKISQEILKNSYDTLNAAKESAANTKLAADYSKRNAENTDILVWCETLKRYEYLKN